MEKQTAMETLQSLARDARGCSLEYAAGRVRTMAAAFASLADTAQRATRAAEVLTQVLRRPRRNPKQAAEQRARRIQRRKDAEVRRKVRRDLLALTKACRRANRAWDRYEHARRRP